MLTLSNQVMEYPSCPRLSIPVGWCSATTFTVITKLVADLERENEL